MYNKHVHSTVTRSSSFHCLIDVINKPKTVELCISTVYRRLAVAKFFKSQCRNCSRDRDHAPSREDFFIGRVGLAMSKSMYQI